MNKSFALEPGKHPCDPNRQDLDPLGYALERVQTMLIWIDEHRASFEKLRDTDPKDAENELHCLQDATRQALLHLERLTELILSGYGIDSSKDLPKGLRQGSLFFTYVKRLREQ